jgi:uncharacterized protein YdcH (DUF465 family)
MTGIEGAAVRRFPEYKEVIVNLVRQDSHFRDVCLELNDTDKRLAELEGQPARLVNVEREMLNRRQEALIEEIAARLTGDNAA